MNQPPVILGIPIPISMYRSGLQLLGPAKLAHEKGQVN